MREVTIGGKPVLIVASVMGIYYYNREFSVYENGARIHDADVAVDAGRLCTGDPSVILLARLLWTMTRTAQHGQPFPGFDQWMGATDLDFTDRALWTAAMEEAAEGYFRAKKTQPAQDGKGLDAA